MTTLGSTALHLCITDFRFTHTFIICNHLPETELIFGIDIQKKFSLSYAWDKDQHCYIQWNGKFLAFTHATTQKTTIGTVKSTLKIPPRHNGVVPIKLSGPLITTDTAHFVIDDSRPKGRDPNINIIDGIQRIKDRSTVNVLISNYTNKHVTFHKGKYVGHLEPIELHSTNQGETHQANSITLKKMMSKTVMSDTFNPPHHKISTHVQNSLELLLKEYESQFAQDEMSIGTTPLTSMSIDTGTADPVSQKPYPIAMKHYDWVKHEIEKLLAAKVICSSCSSWSATIIVVPKGDRGKCLVIDYRALNKVTRKFTWPMPKVEDIFSKLNGATYFTTLDLCTWYHHIPLDKSSIPKTAFNSPFGKYKYIKVPFSLAQAPAYFQELMTGILKDFPFAIAYLDDIIIFSKTPQEDLSHIHMVFEKLRTANLSMKKSKCNFFSKEIQYLGHILSATGIRPLPSKTHAIQHMNPPTTPKQVTAFLGLVGYYRKFIKGFAKIAKLLTLLTRQQVKFKGTPEHQAAFVDLKDAIVQAPILHYPNPNKTYIVYTDASDDACGAQLSQEHDGTKFPIAFLSHTFSKTQCKWSTTEQEALGVYYAITKWNYYLQGANIIVWNDHKPLARFLNGKNMNNKVNRWNLELATYNITFEWISGARNKAADCLSRLVSPTGNSINMLTASVNDGPAFHTRSCTQSTSDSTSTSAVIPQPHISQDNNPTSKSFNSWPSGCLTTDATYRSFLQMYLQEATEWQSPTSQDWHFYPHKGITIQTCVRCWKTIPCPRHSQIMEIHHPHRSSW